MKWLWHNGGSCSRRSAGAPGVCHRAADRGGRDCAAALQNGIRPERMLAFAALPNYDRLQAV